MCRVSSAFLDCVVHGEVLNVVEFQSIGNPWAPRDSTGTTPCLSTARTTLVRASIIQLVN